MTPDGRAVAEDGAREAGTWSPGALMWRMGLRGGDYQTMFDALAIDGPPKKWTFTRPLPRSSPLNRFHILGPVSLDPAQWEKICPRPKGWTE